MHRSYLMMAIALITATLIYGCAGMPKNETKLEVSNLPVYHCEDCKLYFSFKNRIWRNSKGEIISREKEEQCPVCLEEIFKAEPSEGEHVVVIEAMPTEWICGTFSRKENQEYNPCSY